MTSTKCGTKLDHAVQAVGFNASDSTTPYFVVRNSWGPTWGQQGFIYIGMSGGLGICGMNQDVWTVDTNEA